MIDEGDCGAIGGMKVGRETEVLGENLPQHHFVHHKLHMTRPGPPRWRWDPWMGDQPITRPLSTHRTTQTSMPQVGFNPMIPVFERAKTVNALDCTATVMGNNM
jgi:hypothetical protein